MLLIHLALAAFFAIEICSSDSATNHHRVRRIASRRHKKDKNGQNKTETATQSPDGTYKSNNETADYPKDYFLPPDATEAPDKYDYDQDKFNRTYLTQAEWRGDNTNRSHVYKVNRTFGIPVAEVIRPLVVVAPLTYLTPILMGL